ncbi:uncharacterized protein LOC128548502 [Mercenaria mercenaria]|uniref:uncharacterized protein LOC128548502 n=1 Tax=Mercenaria mercenaria TaxID=6596 RepID=UPI00234EC3F8|nr:uncharacterized protein LOC128548502 [Mercenaria mercenaria]
MFNFYTLFWISIVCCVHCEVCSDPNSNSAVPRDCQYGCCTDDDGNVDCCDKPFWTWGVVVGIVVAAIIGVVVIIIIILMCVYCNNQKTHSARLRHTVSMRSNRIRPFPDLPSYEDIETRPYTLPSAPPMYDDVPPPKYEDVLSQDRTNNIPRIQVSNSRPVVSNSFTRTRT